MRFFFLFFISTWASAAFTATTIGIIDTGFDLDHDFLKPKIMSPGPNEFSGWDFHNNTHLKKPVIKDQSLLQEILLYRNLRAKGHTEGLSMAEFEWFKKRSANKNFLNHVKSFKKHSHGTFVAGIALREGENINIFPIRGLHLPTPVVAINDASDPENTPLKSKTPEDKFNEDLKNSQDRVIKKFSKICRYLSINGINIVNASYGITYKNINSKFREKYLEFTGAEIEETKLQKLVKDYFENIQTRTSRIIQKYPRMLFVFSAGNSGIDNDQFPHYPSKIKLPNTISVAAMNGDFLASFSNFGKTHVDIGAPGVAILSLVPKIYSQDGSDLYSPSSGTSMAAPYVANLAAQILNINLKLKPEEIKKIILETGDEKDHLKPRLLSGSIVNNDMALKAALLSRDMVLESSITLAKSGLIQIEDSISIGRPPVANSDELKQKVMDAIPKDISPQEIEEIQATSEESFSPQNSVTDKPGSSVPLPLKFPAVQPPNAGSDLSNQNAEQSPPPSEEPKPSSSPDALQPDQTQYSKNAPSSP
jgi:hypothetical protein